MLNREEKGSCAAGCRIAFSERRFLLGSWNSCGVLQKKAAFESGLAAFANGSEGLFDGVSFDSLVRLPEPEM